MHLRPLGELTVKFTLAVIDAARSRVTLQEHFAAGPMGWISTKWTTRSYTPRNKEALRRPSDLATRKVARKVAASAVDRAAG